MLRLMWIAAVVLSVATMVAAARVAKGSPAGFPDYAETFTVHTTESTQPDGDVTVRQTIVQDAGARRSMMLAHGRLVSGVMQQIRRCDLQPTGWLATIGGPSSRWRD